MDEDDEPDPGTDSDSDSDSGGRRGDTAESATSPERVPATEALRLGVQQLTELLGRTPESVSGLKPTEEGWTAQIEVVEIERIPETTSVLASYEVALRSDGQLLGYERGKRYTRAQVDNGR
ncbi:gas vesicle protein [Streptomyces sp. NPDC048018]|uniref:gas vesicle protein GvpO n=1 Tax=Streptomyces sp. NPDC048018 TaxID=3365499 RepID=UPI0037242E19